MRRLLRVAVGKAARVGDDVALAGFLLRRISPDLDRFAEWEAER